VANFFFFYFLVFVMIRLHCCTPHTCRSSHINVYITYICSCCCFYAWKQPEQAI